MKETTTVFVVMTGDTAERAFSSEELADMFITTHERDYNTYIQPLELDQADKYFDPEQYAKEENTAKNAFSAHTTYKRPQPKQEQGISPADKQIEDLKKAVFYIQDEIKFLKSKHQEQ